MAGEDTVATLVADVVKATRKSKSGTLPVFGKLLFQGAVEDDLARYDAARLASLAASSLDFLELRKAGRPKVRITNPETLPDVSVIEIANDDMPFLVDSVLGALAEAGHEIQLMLHPVLNVARDTSGKLVTLEEKFSPTSALTRESFMHIHVTRIDATAHGRLSEALERILSDVRIAVLDWQAMQARLKEALADYRTNPPPIPVDNLTESIAFLQWLLDNHFTFLGMREYAFEGGPEDGQLKAVPRSGLGILRNEATQVLRRGGELVSITPAIRNFLLEPSALIVTKSDVRATVHRRAAMEYIGVKLFDGDGELKGELRMVGLFTSSAYTQNPTEIPLLRRKIAASSPPAASIRRGIRERRSSASSKPCLATSCSRSIPRRSPPWRTGSCAWRSGRARGCSCGATASTASSRPSPTSRATASTPRSGNASAKSSPRHSTGALPASSRLSARACWSACTSSSCAIRAAIRTPISRRSKATSWRRYGRGTTGSRPSSRQPASISPRLRRAGGVRSRPATATTSRPPNR